MATGERAKSGRSWAAKDKLLEAAGELFYRRGVNAVGIDEVIERAGVAKMSLYNNFASKDELVAEYLRRRHEWWMGWFRERVERARTPRGRVLAVFDALGEWFVEKGFRGCAFLNTAAELCDRKHPAREVCVGHVDELREYLRGLAADAGVRNAPAVGEQLLILVQGAIVGAMVSGGARGAGGAGPAQRAREAAEVVIGAE